MASSWFLVCLTLGSFVLLSSSIEWSVVGDGTLRLRFGEDDKDEKIITKSSDVVLRDSGVVLDLASKSPPSKFFLGLKLKIFEDSPSSFNALLSYSFSPTKKTANVLISPPYLNGASIVSFAAEDNGFRVLKGHVLAMDSTIRKAKGNASSGLLSKNLLPGKNKLPSAAGNYFLSHDLYCGEGTIAFSGFGGIIEHKIKKGKYADVNAGSVLAFSDDDVCIEAVTDELGNRMLRFHGPRKLFIQTHKPANFRRWANLQPVPAVSSLPSKNGKLLGFKQGKRKGKGAAALSSSSTPPSLNGILFSPFKAVKTTVFQITKSLLVFLLIFFAQQAVQILVLEGPEALQTLPKRTLVLGKALVNKVQHFHTALKLVLSDQTRLSEEMASSVN